MSNETVKIRYGENEFGWAELLGGRLARINNLPLFADFWINDIVLLTHLPDEADGYPHIERVVHQQHSHRTLLPFKTADEGRVLTSLLLFVGADAVECIPAKDGKSGSLMVAYDDPINPELLAEAIGIDPDVDLVREVDSPAVPPTTESSDTATRSDDLPSE